MKLEGLYERLGAAGLSYGASFRGLCRAWQRGEASFGEVELPSSARDDGYEIHPALLDSALHTSLASSGSGQVHLPFSWTGVSVASSESRSLRVGICPAASGGLSVTLWDQSGSLVGSVERLQSRPASPEQVRSESRERDLYQLEWSSLPASSTESDEAWCLLGDDPLHLGEPSCRYADLDALVGALSEGAAVPSRVVMVLASCGAVSHMAEETLGAVSRALRALQLWESSELLSSSSLCFVTHRAVAVSTGEDVEDLPHAAVWGLVRSAQSESPGRYVLLDVDGAAGWRSALGQSGSEPQLGWRGGALYAPRLVRARTTKSAPQPARIEAGTVLVTGGTGTLGGLVARRLVLEHGVRQLVLCSRRGGGEQLVSELESMGASVRVEACDVGDRASLKGLLERIAPEHPLVGVVHTAGVMDDGVIGSLTAERLQEVLRPKVDASWHLHELTRNQELSFFVMFSSISGLLGSGGQGSYAAANAFLDALSHHRHALGLRSISLAWGYWSEQSGMTAHLSVHDLARMERSGIAALSSEEALARFSASLSRDEALLAPARIKPTALTRLGDDLPPMFRALVRPSARRDSVADRSAELSARLGKLSAKERERALLELVRGAVETVLGARSVDATRPLQELGMDSLMAVELRNHLGRATGLRLPATLLFDHPTAADIAERLGAELSGRHRKEGGQPNLTDEQIRMALMSIPISVLRDSRVLDAVMDLVRGSVEPVKSSVDAANGQELDAMDADALIELALGDR
jgi:NAD(P)-dependent dehydrogenase (short-subunit alcohol dehydrogenase family)/acyl carrier protein